MTQQELADAAHVDLKTIYNLESGTRWPIARTRAAISAALGWEGDALAQIADGQREGRTGAAPLAVVPDDEDTPPPFTVSPAMQEAMGPYEAAIFRALVYAQQHHPGQALTGDLVFARGQWRGSEAERQRYAGAWDMAGLEADLRRRVQLAAYALVTLDQKAARGRGHGKASAG